MLKSIITTLVFLALAAPTTAQEKQEFLGQHLREHMKIYEQLAKDGKTMLGLEHLAYDQDGNACLGETGFNKTAYCPTFSSNVRVKVRNIVLYDKPPVAASAQTPTK